MQSKKLKPRATRAGTQPRRPRRTNAERSAATRGKLIAAAINILYREGHAATTTISVAAKARVSRGAMLHQFPTRVAMLMAVVEHIMSEQSHFRRENLGEAQFATPLDRFYAAADVSWKVHSEPAAIALLEIIMATRSDRALSKGFAPITLSWAKRRRLAAVNMAADLGIKDVDAVEAMIGVHQAGLRGLALELMFRQDRKVIERQRQLLADYDRSYVKRLMSESVAKPRRAKR